MSQLSFTINNYWGEGEKLVSIISSEVMMLQKISRGKKMCFSSILHSTMSMIWHLRAGQDVGFKN